MTTYSDRGGLRVAEQLHAFVVDEAMPGTGLDPEAFWSGLGRLVEEMAPRTAAVLAERQRLQRALDEFHRDRPGDPDPARYGELLRELGYLEDEPADVTITTADVDPEIATLAGPQLVVPLLNARFATNAVNARWGSLYDALYGTDTVPETEGRERGASYNPVRGAEVVARGRAFLDEAFPLRAGSHRDAGGYRVKVGSLVVTGPAGDTTLADPTQCLGYRGPTDAPEAVVLVHHGLRVEIQIDREHPIGRGDPAGVKDVQVEAALTTIMDLEDSVAAVDADDKVLGYRNWLGLMQGTLAEEVTKDGASFTRAMNPDRGYTTLAGAEAALPARSVLFVRHVGHLMTTDAVLDGAGKPIPEGLLDAVMTALGSLHELQGRTLRPNSSTGSMYVVKPKLHGPEEVRLTCDTFAGVEELLGMAPGTIKIGIMDEERRTSVNLKACIAAARNRVVFVNTGFLDRTGDEIHTSTLAGPMVRKAEIKNQAWIASYEARNVAIGLECGFRGRAQIGKGMWAAPENLADMLEQKVGQPRAGASCAWVPSPTAAVLHALHYHQVDVSEVQRELEASGVRPGLEGLLTVPLADPAQWSETDRMAELDNNVQSTLGYIVRWVNMGVGCSKVPDLLGTRLMEDRATCRISSQHVANWLYHGVVTEAQVEDSLRRMAVLVDEQNAADPVYRAMAPDYDGQAFLAARELVLAGLDQPAGYTEPVLHRRRAALKTTQGNRS